MGSSGGSGVRSEATLGADRIDRSVGKTPHGSWRLPGGGGAAQVSSVGTPSLGDTDPCLALLETHARHKPKYFPSGVMVATLTYMGSTYSARVVSHAAAQSSSRNGKRVLKYSGRITARAVCQCQKWHRSCVPSSEGRERKRGTSLQWRGSAERERREREERERRQKKNDEEEEQRQTGAQNRIRPLCPHTCGALRCERCGYRRCGCAACGVRRWLVPRMEEEVEVGRGEAS
ncbi:unnamed protein product [Lampetra fluviatilis]